MTKEYREISGLRMPDGRAARAVIFDVYHTLLQVEPGPSDAAERWNQLCRETVAAAATGACLLSGKSGETCPADEDREAGHDSAQAVPTLAGFGAACRREIAREHAAKNAAGIRWPEVDWRDISRRACPLLAALPEEELDAFLTAHAGLERRCSAMPGAVEFLETVRQSGALAGIASNAQKYTLHELSCSDMEVGAWFEDSLCFWSWREGFSKPDPNVFGALTLRLAARGIAADEILMIGDRLDNDILPARAVGWQTWHFRGEWPWP